MLLDACLPGLSLFEELSVAVSAASAPPEFDCARRATSGSRCEIRAAVKDAKLGYRQCRDARGEIVIDGEEGLKNIGGTIISRGRRSSKQTISAYYVTNGVHGLFFQGQGALARRATQCKLFVGSGPIREISVLIASNFVRPARNLRVMGTHGQTQRTMLETPSLRARSLRH